ncbi:MAG: RNA 2',3'-cyclic phosphodiesterase [Anaerolinea sp.]|nr:RNA 2',3'-cyclic phosphodiesterase [Anaerolinea sp.]
MLLRSFIAIQMPTAIQDEIEKSTAHLKKALARPLVRWIHPHNVHLTLKFLGDVSSANLELLAHALKRESEQHAGFSLSIGGLGIFPNSRRPRVIWIGIEAPAAMQTLYHGIEAAAAHLGYASETRPFSPHLTIGRVNQNVSMADIQKIRATLEQATVGTLGAAPVDAVHIYKSDLQPGGSVYTHLYTAPLKIISER